MWRELIPEPGPARRLVALTLVQSAGNGLFLTSSAVFLVRVVGLTPAEVGLGLSIAGLAGFVATVPVGRLADRYGAGRMLAGNYAALAVLFSLYPLVRGPVAFVLLASLISIGEITGSPLRAAVMHALFAPKEAVRARAQVRSAYNVGFMAGAAVAAVALAEHGYPAFWAVCGGTALAQGLCVFLVHSLPSAAAETRSASTRSGLGAALRDGPFLTIAIGNGLLELHTTLLTVGVPLWIVSQTSAPPSLASAVILTNTVIVLLLQVQASRGAETVHGSARLLRRSGWLLAAGCAVFAVSRGASPLVGVVIMLAGTAVLSLGEISQAAGGWGLAFELAQPGRQGEYQGVFALGRGVQQFLGPLIVTTLLVGVGAAGWLVMGTLFALTGLLVRKVALALRPVTSHRAAVARRRAQARHRLPQPRKRDDSREQVF